MDLDVLEDIRTQLEKLSRELEPNALDANGARMLLRRSVAIKRFAESLEILAIQRVDSTGTWATSGHRSIGSFVAAAGGTPVGAANALVETAQQVAGAPVIEDAMRAGLLSAPKLAEVVRGVKAAPDKAGHLVDTAIRNGFGGLRDEVKRVIAAADPQGYEERYARATAERSVRCWEDGAVGHIKIEGPLHRYAEIRNAIQGEARRVFRDAHREGRREPHAAYCFDALERLIVDPTDADPGTADSVTNDPSTADPTSAEATTDPAHADPTTNGPATGSTATDALAADAMTEPTNVDANATGTTTDPPAVPTRTEATTAGTPAAASGSTTRTKTKAKAKRRRRKRARNVHLNIHVGLEPLRRGEVHDGEICEIPGVGPIPASVARQYLGDAFVTAILRDGKDIRTVVHLGRYLPAELRTALTCQPPECIVEDCANRGYLEIDHHHDYAKGGPTAHENLGPVCRPHQIKKNQGFTLGPTDPHTGKRRLYPPGTDQPDIN